MNQQNKHITKKRALTGLSDFNLFTMAFVGIIILTVTFGQNAWAEEQNTPAISSFGQLKSGLEITKPDHESVEQQTQTTAHPIELQSKDTQLELSESEKKGKSRDVIQILKNAKAIELNGGKEAAPFSANHYYSFSIYNAFSTLIEDVDGDGYFQTFSTVFDVDLHSNYKEDYAEIYAELYISKNGGPWEYYFTTENFYIYGDNADDEYEVTSTLHQGYIGHEYDILIDVYEVGYEGIVATISANEVNGLYALPLESAEYDQYEQYEQVTVIESYGYGGSYNALILIGLLFVLCARMLESIGMRKRFAGKRLVKCDKSTRLLSHCSLR